MSDEYLPNRMINRTQTRKQMRRLVSSVASRRNSTHWLTVTVRPTLNATASLKRSP